MEEFRIDMRKPEEADPAEGTRCAQLCFKINHTMPMTEEYNRLVSELFMGNTLLFIGSIYSVFKHQSLSSSLIRRR